MAIGSKVSDSFKSAANLYAKVNGGWKKAQFGYIKVDGVWKQFWASELNDTFGRADTSSGLGTAESGQAWTIARSQWRINSNFANTTGTKSDYPLATVDTGFVNFTAEANELSPGMGIAFRVTDPTNWFAVIPWYNRVAFSYQQCAEAVQESYCIAQCSEPYSYDYVCPVAEETFCEEFCYDDCPGGYDYTGDVIICVDEVCTPCVERVCETFTEEYNCCIRYCGFAGFNFCCDRDICTRTVQECTNQNCGLTCECTGYDVIFGDIICPGGEELVCETDCYSDCPVEYVEVPLYECCQSGIRSRCIRTETVTGFNDFFYVRVIRMINGVVSVVSDTQVNSRWNAVKMSGNNTTLTIDVYSNASYTNQVGSTITLTNTGGGTSYGIVGAPSSYEDGRNIGAITVKAFGQ